MQRWKSPTQRHENYFPNRRHFLKWALGALPVLHNFSFEKKSTSVQGKDILIDDLASFGPPSAVSKEYRPGAWWWREKVEGAREDSLLVTGSWREERPRPTNVEDDAPGAADNYVALVPNLKVNPQVRG